MIKELSWYIESNRFSDIVTVISEKAEGYALALRTESEDKFEKRQDFHDCIEWHIEHSGYSIGDESLDSYIDNVLFPGGDLNNEKLDEFEKNIIKAHMYQKHLWDYMGTTGSFTVISKNAMEKNGFKYEDVLPIDYDASQKSPISNILSSSPKAVPIYVYDDGSVSTEYDKRKARLHFDSLKDKSGFDWNMKGWDPNYEVKKDGWKGLFSNEGTWVPVEIVGKSVNSSGEAGEMNLIPEMDLEVIRDGETAVLYDPFYEFIIAYIYMNSVEDEQELAENQQKINMVRESIRTALSNLGVTKISSIVRNPSLKNTEQTRSKLVESLSDDSKVVELYRLILGDVMTQDIQVREIGEVRKQQETEKENTKKRVEAEEGENLGNKVSFVLSRGLTGNDAVKAVLTGMMPIPLDYESERDCVVAGIDEEEYAFIKKYEVPAEKKEEFNKVLFNVLDDYEVLATSGMTKRELITDVYEKVVLGKKLNKDVDVETTFEKMLKNPDPLLVDSALSEDDRNRFESLREVALKSCNASEAPILNSYFDNAMKSSGLISRNTGMDVDQIVDALIAVFRKNVRVIEPGISYKAYQKIADGSTRLFASVSMDEIIEEAMEQNPVARVRDFVEEFQEEEKSASVNFYDSESLQKWYASSAFAESGLSREDVAGLVGSVRSSAPSSVRKIETSQSVPFKLKRNSDHVISFETHSVKSSSNSVPLEMVGGPALANRVLSSADGFEPGRPEAEGPVAGNAVDQPVAGPRANAQNVRQGGADFGVRSRIFSALDIDQSTAETIMEVEDNVSTYVDNFMLGFNIGTAVGRAYVQARQRNKMQNVSNPVPKIVPTNTAGVFFDQYHNMFCDENGQCFVIPNEAAAAGYRYKIPGLEVYFGDWSVLKPMIEKVTPSPTGKVVSMLDDSKDGMTADVREAKLSRAFMDWALSRGFCFNKVDFVMIPDEVTGQLVERPVFTAIEDFSLAVWGWVKEHPGEDPREYFHRMVFAEGAAETKDLEMLGPKGVVEKRFSAVEEYDATPGGSLIDDDLVSESDFGIPGDDADAVGLDDVNISFSSPVDRQEGNNELDLIANDKYNTSSISEDKSVMDLIDEHYRESKKLLKEQGVDDFGSSVMKRRERNRVEGLKSELVHNLAREVVTSFDSGDDKEDS